MTLPMLDAIWFIFIYTKEKGDSGRVTKENCSGMRGIRSLKPSRPATGHCGLGDNPARVGAQSGCSEEDSCLHWHCTNRLVILLLSVLEGKLRLTWESCWRELSFQYLFVDKQTMLITRIVHPLGF